MRSGSKSHVAPRPWHSGQAPCGELNENARGVISGTLNAAGHARQTPREEPIAAVERVDDDDVVGEGERGLDRIREPPFDPRADDQAIDDHFDRVVAPPIELDVVFEGTQLAVDARPGEPAGLEAVELLPKLALPPADDRREHVDARVLRVGEHQIHDPLERLRRDLPAAARAVRHADVREEQAQVIVDFGDGPHGRARVRSRRLLLDRDGGRQAPRSDRRPASPSARGTAGRTPTATRRTVAGPPRRSCRRRATTCPTPTGR